MPSLPEEDALNLEALRSTAGVRSATGMCAAGGAVMLLDQSSADRAEKPWVICSAQVSASGDIPESFVVVGAHA
jgi:hypothetical protein